MSAQAVERTLFALEQEWTRAIGAGSPFNRRFGTPTRGSPAADGGA